MIRTMETNDIDRVAELKTNSWRHAYGKMMSDEFLFHTLSVAKTSKNWVLNPGAFVFDDGIVKGFMDIGPCRDEDSRDGFEVYAIYLDPFFMRQGLGTKLLEYAESVAKQEGYPYISLWVLEENAPGRSFYESRGFAFDGSRKKWGSLWEIRYKKELGR